MVYARLSISCLFIQFTSTNLATGNHLYHNRRHPQFRSEEKQE